MSEPSRPQWHLSTAVTMMVIAGSLLPLVIWAYRRSIALDAEGNNLQGYYGVLIVCGMIVYYTGRVCEWLIRRREARKT